MKLNQILLLRFLKSARAFLKENAALSSRTNVTLGKRKRGGDEDAEEEDLPSDPETAEEDDDEGRPAIAQTPTGGTVLITLFTCKPYDLWTLP